MTICFRFSKRSGHEKRVFLDFFPRFFHKHPLLITVFSKKSRHESRVFLPQIEGGHFGQFQIRSQPKPAVRARGQPAVTARGQPVPSLNPR